jgi:hypothetical protein
MEKNKALKKETPNDIITLNVNKTNGNIYIQKKFLQLASILNILDLKGMQDSDNMPMLSIPFLDWLNAYDFSDYTLVEFGSGYSTNYFATRFKNVISFETRPEWFDEVSKFKPSNVDLRMISIEDITCGNYDIDADDKTIFLIDGDGPRHIITKLILEKYSNVHYINKSVSHYDIIKLRPECIITNHGTIAHEYAAFKIPVINTGDNPHINYKFCFHAKNIKQLNYIMSNLKELKKRINFDKKEIYEYLYMHYEYFPKKFNENIYLKDRYFSSRNIKVNSHEKLLEQFIKYKNNYDVNIFKYLNNFFK